MYLDLGRWITGSAWCSSGPYRPEEASLDLSLCCSVSLHLKGTWETHQTFCVSLVLISFTLIYRAAHPFLVKHSTKLPVTGCLRTKGQESVCETCACVIHTVLLN